MLYLLDTSVLITAKNLYYEFGRVNEYWEWLAFHAEQGNVKMPKGIYEEIAQGQDKLVEWAKKNKSVLVLDEDVDENIFHRVITKGYASDLDKTEMNVVAQDPFLIVHALMDTANRMVVTAEVRSNKTRHNRTIPSVCDDLGVDSCDQYDFGRALDFRTDWKAG